jgi:Tfp pilus assembly protein PilF/DNA-binding CsgD family transcriptional regulator
VSAIKRKFSTPNAFARFAVKTGIVMFFISSYITANGLPQGKVQIAANIFDRVRNVPIANRVKFADSVYKNTFRKTDAATAMAALDKLRQLSIDLDDKPLECAVFDMRADYYAFNRGYNPISTAYYQNAIGFAKENNMLLETGIYLNNMGMYLVISKQYAPACGYYLRSEEVFKSIGYKNVPGIYNYLLRVALFYYRLGDFENARINLEQALKYAPYHSRDRINIVNTIGLIYRNNKQYGQAVDYFSMALATAIANKDTVWIGIAKGNVGSVYFMQGLYKKARPLIEADYTTSLKYNEPVNAALALLRLTKINIDNKNMAVAGRGLDTIKQLIKGTKEDVLTLLDDYDDLRSQFYEQTGNPVLALVYRKRYELDRDSLVNRNNIAAVERVKLRYEADKRIAELSKARATERVQAVEIKAGIAVLVLLVAISLLLYNRQRLASKKDKELLMAEKKVVDEELRYADIALRGFTENLRQKNLLIEEFKTEIDQLNKRTAGNDNAGQLEKLLQAHIMTDQNWNDFKKLFAKVYPGFFVNVSKKYPHLSATDTRLLALIKLGLNNAEMANMLGITVEGIKKAKQRLRKKIDIQAVEAIESIKKDS